MTPPAASARGLTILALVALVVTAATTLLGPTPLQWGEFRELDSVFWRLRVPRTLLAGLAGGGLALGGALFQALFRNPLATPYTLGVASGASLGAATVTLLGLGGVWTLGAGITWELPVRQGAAILGGLAATALVLTLTRTRAGRDLPRLLLAGVCVAYLSSAGILLITYLADATITNDIVIWLMGSLAVMRPAANIEIAGVLLPLAAAALLSSRGLDLLMLGDDLAATRGVRVGLITYGLFIGTSLLVALIVANCGPIGFVGLMVPHMLRAFVGAKSGPLIIASMFAGGAFLAVCDGLGRFLFGAGELPVGVVTNLLGAVFFFALLFGRRPAFIVER